MDRLQYLAADGRVRARHPAARARWSACGCGGRPAGCVRSLAPGLRAVRGVGPLGDPHGHVGLQPATTRSALTLPGGMAIEELVFFTVIPVCGLLTLEAVRRILGARGAGLMPIYPTLAVAAAVAVVAARGGAAPHRPVPRPGVLDLDGHLLRVHDPGGRLAHEALGADRDLPPGGHQRHLPDLGHPAGGVRLRLRAAHRGDAHVGPPRPAHGRRQAGATEVAA